MSQSSYELIVKRFFEDVLNQGDQALVDDLFAPDVVYYDPGNPFLPRGRAGIRQFVKIYRAAFPDLHVTLDELFAYQDTIIARWMLRGTHSEAFLGYPRTGKRVIVVGTTLFTLFEDQIVDCWVAWDALGLLRQVGIVGQLEVTGAVA